MTILNVGTGQQFSTIASAVAASKDGDVVSVRAGTYVNDFATINTRITIQGVGGMADLVATRSPPDGKAILTTNADVTIDNLSFSGAKVPDGNGAGIRYQGGNLTITDSHFHDNQNGLLSGTVPGGSITIRNSEFSRNGAGDGYTHNLYVGEIGRLTIADSYFHDALVGHEIKSRAHSTEITGSRIVDGPNGTASYSIDLPNGGNAVVRGNLIGQGPRSENPAIIHFGGEGGPYAGSSLQVTGNTVRNDLPSPSASLLLNQTAVTATIADNDVYGLRADQIARGPASVSDLTILAGEPALDTSSPWTSSAPPPVVAAPGAPAPVATAPKPDPVVAAPAPVASTPTAATIGSGADSLVLRISEDAWQGHAQYAVTVDGRQVGGTQTAAASHAAGQQDVLTVKGDWSAGTHQVGIQFLNDAYAGTPGTDRNLYVEGAAYNGQAVSGSGAALFGPGTARFAFTEAAAAVPAAPVPQPVQSGAGSSGAVSPGPVPSGAVTVGSGPDTLLFFVSEDAWRGDAQYVVSVDGRQIGGTQTATASHAAGRHDLLAVRGDWGMGSHEVVVRLTNDAWGGTPDTDRNLYVDGVAYNGAAVPNGAHALLAGQFGFSFYDPLIG